MLTIGDLINNTNPDEVVINPFAAAIEAHLINILHGRARSEAPEGNPFFELDILNIEANSNENK